MKGICILLLSIYFIAPLKAQDSLRIIVTNPQTKRPVSGANISERGGIVLTTDSAGACLVTVLQPGQHHFSITSIGYNPFELVATIPGTSLYEVLLEPDEQNLDEVIIVSSTRTNQRIENSPLKVEVLGSEEMNEENVIKPGNIASILGDISGIQIQQSSAVSGNANVRIQGLDGRYTQILRDGIPLFDGFSGGFGILTIPPLDLKQVELIKGSASTLYGGGAIGGLINLISRKPTFQQEGLLTLNHSTLNETNLNTYIAKRNKHYGYNFFGGVTNQQAVDVNKDGFSDVAKTTAIILHPKLFFYPGDHTIIAAGYTGSFEKRTGGDMQVIRSAASANHQFFEKNNTNRNTFDLLVSEDLGNGQKLELKAGISSFSRSIYTNKNSFEGSQLNYFTEASYSISKEMHSLVTGINATGDRFKKLKGTALQLDNFANNTIGAFAQYNGKLTLHTTLELGLRTDHHFTYGNFFLPRIAVFDRFNEQWATRAGMGFGYKTPNALSPQNVDYEIENILPLPKEIKAEKSVGYNAELNFKKNFSPHSSLFINHAFFLTQVQNPVIATVLANEQVAFSNAGKNITSKGFDSYIRFHQEDWELYLGYTFTIVNRNYLQQNKFMPLTPKNRFAFVIVHEIGDLWRFGLEGSYTGPQFRDGDSKTAGYLFLAGLVEKKFGDAISVVLNCENLLDYRQSKHEALYTGSMLNPSFKP
ncbi:MAG: TonB-dependent receptor, partial [Bacteroidota bacterium]